MNPHKLTLLNTRPHAEHLLLPPQFNIIHFPVFDIQPLSFECSAEDLTTFDWIIFISPNAVHCFFSSYQPLQTWPKTLKTFGIGPGTSKALSHYKIDHHIPPPPFNAENLFIQLELQSIQNKKILIIKGEEGLSFLQNKLKQKKAQVHIIYTYKRQPSPTIHERLQELYEHQPIDFILITSETTLNNLFNQLPDTLYQWLLNKHYLIFSDRIANKAKQLGIQHFFITPPDQWITILKKFIDNQNQV